MTAENWTDTDRKFIDTVQQLTEEEKNFMLQIMTLATENEKAADFITENAKNYHLGSQAGRAALLAAAQGI